MSLLERACAPKTAAVLSRHRVCIGGKEGEKPFDRRQDKGAAARFTGKTETRPEAALLWAQLQCMGLLHRHRLRRKTQNHVNDFGRKLAQNSAVPVIGETLYALGYSTEYGFVRVGRGLRSGWLWLWQAFTTLLANAAAMAFPGAAQMFRDLFGPIWLFFRGCGSLLVHAQRVRKEKALPQPAKPAYIIWPAACAAT